MNLDAVIGLLGMALGLLLTLAFQAHQKAQKAVKEAKEAVKSVDELAETLKYQRNTFERQQAAHIDVYQADLDKRIQKIEIRIDDLNSRVASLQMKR